MSDRPFELTWESGNRYLLRNVSDATRTLVTVTATDHPEGLTRRLPAEITLLPQG